MTKKTKKTKKNEKTKTIKKCAECRCKPCLCKKDIHCYEIRCDYDPNNPKKKQSRKAKRSKKKKKPKQKGGAFCAPCIAAAPSFPSLAAAAGAAVTGGISVMKRSFSQKVGKQVLQGKEEIYEKITETGKKIKKSFLLAKDKKSNKYYVQVGKTKKRFDTYKQALKHFRERIKKCKRLGFEKC